MRYSFKQFDADFPNDDACLEYIFWNRWPNGGKCDCGPLGIAPRNGEPDCPTGQKENDSPLTGAGKAPLIGKQEVCISFVQAPGQSPSEDYGFLSLASLKQCYGTNRVLPYDSTLFVGALLFLSVSLFFYCVRSDSN